MNPPQRISAFTDQRSDERDGRFTGEYSCCLIPKENEGKRVLIRPLDVSRRGLGFIVREPLKPGSYYWLVIGDRQFRVEVAYCHSHLGIENLFRCGLFIREAEGDLTETCRACGLLAA